MRTMTDQQDAILAAVHRSNHVRVQIDRGSGDWVDMTTLEGRNWVHSVEYGGDIDRSVIEATVMLTRKVDGFNLAPLVDGSKLNASGTIVDIGHPIIIEVAVLGVDYQPIEADWIEVFRGEIDAVDWNRSPIKLQCRDQGGALEAFIETQQKRPADPSTSADVEDIMQEILDQVFGASQVVLYSPNGTGGTPINPGDSPAWVITEYIQRKQSVIQALRVLSDQIGWALRYRWHDNTSAFQLQLYDPNRELSARGILLLDGQPLNNETFVVNATTFTAKTSGAGTDEFNIGATIGLTGQAIADMLNAGSESSNIKAWYDPTSGTAKVVVEWLDRGTAGNSVTFTTAMTNSAMDGAGTLGGAVQGVGVTSGRSARGKLTLTGQPSTTETFVVNNTTCTAVAGAPGVDQFQIAGTVALTCINIASMLNAGSESSNIRAWYSSLGGNFVFIEWLTQGVVGNSVTFTESMSNTTADGSGTLGGTRQGVDPAGARTFGPSQYYSIDRLGITRANIRNVVQVKYGVDPRERTTIVADDTASITKYGRRFMEIAEAATSQIDTISEAHTLANAIVDDLKEPDLDKSVTIPFFWPVEFGDYYTFEANDVHYDTDQSLAVLGFRHSLTEKKCRTVLSCRGKPAGGLKRWFMNEARPGVGGENNFYNSDAAQNVDAEAAIATIVVTYDDPRSMSPAIDNWAYSKCYVDTSSGFTPSDSNLKAFGRQTRFEVGGLIPGTTYYALIEMIDTDNNVAATSAQVSVATQKVGPYHTDNNTEVSSLVRNQNFGIFTLDPTTTPPDFWEVLDGTWGSTDDIYFDETTHRTGDRSITLAGNTNDKRMISELFPVSQDLYAAQAWVSRDSGTPGVSAFVGVWLKWYDKDGVFISETTLASILQTAMSPGVWYHLVRRGGEPPSTARFGRVAFGGVVTSGSFLKSYVDTASAFRYLPTFEASPSSTQGVGAGSPTSGWVGVSFGTENYDHGSNFASDQFTCPDDGFYLFESHVETTGLSGGYWQRIAFLVNGSTRYESDPAYQDTTTTITPFSSNFSFPMIFLFSGDTVDVEIEHNDPVSVTIQTASYFRGRQISEANQ